MSVSCPLSGEGPLSVWTAPVSTPELALAAPARPPPPSHAVRCVSRRRRRHIHIKTWNSWRSSQRLEVSWGSWFQRNIWTGLSGSPTPWPWRWRPQDRNLTLLFSLHLFLIIRVSSFLRNKRWLWNSLGLFSSFWICLNLPGWQLAERVGSPNFQIPLPERYIPKVSGWHSIAQY